eukprot:COSAG01_NODE_28407_length_661_cov_6.222420_1_plen_88_part_00
MARKHVTITPAQAESIRGMGMAMHGAGMIPSNFDEFNRFPLHVLAVAKRGAWRHHTFRWWPNAAHRVLAGGQMRGRRPRLLLEFPKL